MAIATAIAQAAGGVMTAQGALDEGKQNYKALTYNADIADQNAAEVRGQAAEEERRTRVQARKIIGDERANYGASGVTQSGSVIDVLQDSAANAEMDALNVRHAGEVKAVAYQNDARISRMSAEQALKGSQLSAISALLGGGAKAYAALPYTSAVGKAST